MFTMKIAEGTITEAMAEDVIIPVGRCLMETGTILEILASWKEMVLQRLKINDITSIPMESWQQMDGFTVVSGIMRMHLENLRLAIHGLMERCIILTKMEA